MLAFLYTSYSTYTYKRFLIFIDTIALFHSTTIMNHLLLRPVSTIKNAIKKKLYAAGKPALISGILLAAALNSGAQGTWTPVASPAPDYNQGVMLLLTDGSVLVKSSSGGSTGIGSGWNRLRPDIHGSYVNGTWSTAGGMADSRLYFSTQVLKNGCVYAAGGEYGSGRTRAEVYFPDDDLWYPTTPLLHDDDTLSDANSEILPDGRVLQAVVISGGTVSHHTYIFDPATSTFTAGPNTIGLDNESSWIKLKDNSILFPDIYATTTERYIPATNTWVHDASLPIQLYDAYGFETGGAFVLPDGRGFFIGSTSHTAYYTPSGTTSPGSWTIGPDIPDSLGAPDAASAMMTNGKILCVFSHTPTMDSVFHGRMKFFEFDYQTNTFTSIPAPDGSDSIEAAAYISNMLCLPDGSILYGNQGDDQYYIYKPDGSPLAAGKPTVNKVYTNYCDTFIATGMLFNGICEGASYGDDWQMNTNYPIIRLTRNDTVYYASTYNWNSTGIMRGTAPDTTQFVIPPSVPPGDYQLQVVANGIASDPFNFSFCHGLDVNNVAKNVKRVTAYPNPASDEVNIEYTADHAGSYTLTLTDMYGRKALQQQRSAVAGTNTTTLQLTGMAKGIYTATIHDGEKIYVARVVIK